MGNCGAKNVKRETQIRKPMLKSNPQQENKVPVNFQQNNFNIPNAVSLKQESQMKMSEKQREIPYFVPEICNELPEEVQKIFESVTKKQIVDQLISGKSIMEIISEEIIMIKDFENLVCLVRELIALITYVDKEKMREITQINSLIIQLKNMQCFEIHEEFMEFIEQIKEDKYFESFDEAKELEQKAIYLLVETFAAFQVIRNDCYRNERRHWWRPIKEDPSLKEIEFGPLIQQNQNTNNLIKKEIITEDYLNYYLNQFTMISTEYQEYIKKEDEKINQLKQQEEIKRQQEEEEQLKLKEEEEKNRQIELERLEEQKRTEEEEQRIRELQEKQIKEQQLYEEEQERIRQEMYNNQLFEEDEEQVDCKPIGDINNLQFHVKRQLIA